MTAKKLAIGAGLAGAGVFAARTIAPKLNEHCQSMCAGGKCGGARDTGDPHEPAEHTCAPQPVRDDALAA
jgi:hypothetical protein